jgi:asparagine synthase (glutamine-hydrolysing)
MGKFIPSSVATAPKRGFSSPDASWFRGSSIDFVRNRLLNRSDPLYELFDFTIINTLLEDHFTGRHNRRLLIWSLLSLQVILKQNDN